MLWGSIPPPPIAPPPALSPRASRYGLGYWHNTRGYRSSLTRARIAQLAVALTVLGTVPLAAAAFQGYGFVQAASNGVIFMPFELEPWAESLVLGFVAFLLCVPVAGLAFVAWLSRAVDNLPHVASGTPQMSPRETMVWWYVPLANLPLRYMIMREAWDRYATPARSGRFAIVAAWWLSSAAGIGLVTLALALFVAESAQTAGNDPVAARDLGRLLFASLGIGPVFLAVSAVLSIAVIELIERRASERARALGLTAPRWLPSPLPGSSMPWTPSWVWGPSTGARPTPARVTPPGSADAADVIRFTSSRRAVLPPPAAASFPPPGSLQSPRSRRSTPGDAEAPK